jgi:hypothetical protein
MNDWPKLSKNRRLEILKQVNKSFPAFARMQVEKDWLRIVLKAIFTSQPCAVFCIQRRHTFE